MEISPQIAVIDFGSQYTQLIVRRLREAGYFAKLYHPENFKECPSPKGVILSGGPRSVSDEDAPDIDLEHLLSLDVPVLGICYGMQLLNKKHGGRVEPGRTREYGPAELRPEGGCGLFDGVSGSSQIWMSHSDTCTKLPEGAEVIGRNEDGVPVAVQLSSKVFGIQFHPEVTHSHEGKRVLDNYLAMVDDPPRFNMDSFKEVLIESVREEIGDREVVCGVSGGVDSTVLAVLLHHAGAKLRAIYVDNGLMRKNETAEVVAQFERLGIELEVINAGHRFLEAISGIDEPEEKRRRIGDMFVDVFFAAADNVELLAQGTLYPDVIESATSGSIASTIKTHHNRVQRILDLQEEGKVIEPLAELFKDEVRALGESFGIPREILYRHPFPGPGLGVRVPGVVTEEKLAIVREGDAIFMRHLKESGWYDKVWQAYCGLLPIKTVGVKGDERSYEWAVSLRAVTSEDAMTADWVEFPAELLRVISNEILNSVEGINRVFYDISTKPPASIELE
ncbi:MAG: glutamine-hydrolyzing GMP synthase [Verrucomicrobiales bacterium]|nr:glutamine-hydrolyzing GMP synthase [Verrucomicrobiales bacterium]